MHYYVWNPEHPEHAVLIDAPTAADARSIAAKASARVAAPLCAWPHAYGHPAEAPAAKRRTRELSLLPRP